MKQITQPIINKTSSSPEEHHSDNDDEEQALSDQSGSESPRTSALRAMGGEAAQGVINYMMNTQGEQPTYDPPHEGLTTISEESEMEKSLPKQQQRHGPTITITQVCSLIYLPSLFYSVDTYHSLYSF